MSNPSFGAFGQEHLSDVDWLPYLIGSRGAVIAEVFTQGDNEVNWRYLHVTKGGRSATGLSSRGIARKSSQRLFPGVEKNIGLKVRSGRDRSAPQLLLAPVSRSSGAPTVSRIPVSEIASAFVVF